MATPAAARGAIVVIDYGMGNLRSVWQALVRVADGRAGARLGGSGRGRLLPNAWSFPARGRCRTACARSTTRGLRSAVLEAARNKPFLGICIGQQMLFEHSEEGDVPGLGLIAGTCRRFPGEKMIDAMGRKAQGAAHGLERGQAQLANTRSGKALPTMRASISCTVTSSNPVDEDCVVGSTDMASLYQRSGSG
jgi:hypothetical protein